MNDSERQRQIPRNVPVGLQAADEYQGKRVEGVG